MPIEFLTVTFLKATVTLSAERGNCAMGTGCAEFSTGNRHKKRDLLIETSIRDQYFIRCGTFGSAPSAKFVTNFEILQRSWRRNLRKFRPLSDLGNMLRNQCSYLTVPANLAWQPYLTPGRGDGGGGGPCSKEVTDVLRPNDQGFVATGMD